MNQGLILLILFSTLSYGQNDSIKWEQLNSYYKERGYVIPEPNTAIESPSNTSQMPTVTKEETKAYPLGKELDTTKHNSNTKDYKLSLYEKDQINQKNTEKVLNDLGDNRISTTEYVSEDEIESTNKALMQNKKKEHRSIYSYLIFGLLVSFVIFIGIRIKGKY